MLPLSKAAADEGSNPAIMLGGAAGPLTHRNPARVGEDDTEPCGAFTWTRITEESTDFQQHLLSLKALSE